MCKVFHVYNVGDLQYGKWLRVQGPQPGQGEGGWRNGVEVLEEGEEKEEGKDLTSYDGKKDYLAKTQQLEVTRSSEETSTSCSPNKKKAFLFLKDREARNKGKRKKGKGLGEGFDNSPVRMVRCKLSEGLTTSKAEPSMCAWLLGNGSIKGIMIGKSELRFFKRRLTDL